MSFDAKTYHIDNEPASANDIIKKAKEYSEEYAEGCIHQTSAAARILRNNGHEVGDLIN